MVSPCPVHAWASRSPGALALVSGSARWNYAELDREVAGWAGRLSALGVGQGDRVAVLAWNGLAAVSLVFAVRRLRATLVLLNARLTSTELGLLVGRARPRLVLAEEGLAERIPGCSVLEAVARRTAVPHPATLALVPEEDWAVLFTSGTTGQPKGARLGVGALLASAAASRANLGGSPEDRWLCTLPLFHVGGLAMAIRAAADGAALLVLPRFEAAEVARALAEEAVTHTSFVARTLELTLEAGGRPGALRAALVGGGPLPGGLAARARTAGFPVLQTYGLTEASSQVATERPSEADGTTAGPPLPGLELRIAAADSVAAPAEVAGEIQLRGPTLMAGYLDEPEATARALDGGWLHTGDLGSLDGRGRLRVFARRTDLILSGGENVYPAEVEAVLVAHPGVAEAAVVGRSDPAWGEVPVAAVVLRPGGGLEGLEAWARGRLAGFKVPAEVVALPALPRTTTEKVDRLALRRTLDAARLRSPPPATGGERGKGVL